MKTKILILMLVSLPVSANCTNVVNLMERCYTKEYLASIAKQKAFFETHKKCYSKYIKQNEECIKPKKVKKKMIKSILIISTMLSPMNHVYTSAGKPKFVNHSYQLVTTKPKVTPKDIDRYIHNASLKYHVDEKLVRAVIKTESTYRTKAVSKKGAYGLMQLMPATAERFGVTDRTNVKENIYGGVRFLRFLLDTFDGNKKLALAGYNAGENAVMRHHNKIPNYPETINYVTLVLTEYKRGTIL